MLSPGQVRSCVRKPSVTKEMFEQLEKESKALQVRDSSLRLSIRVGFGLPHGFAPKVVNLFLKSDA